MAFMTKNLIDPKGIFILILLTATSQATNLDCNGKAFHCVNSTHFMICVDLGGISTTIDEVIITCPPPTVCQNTNRFECEFPIPVTTARAVTTVSEVTTETPSVATSIQLDQYFDTVSTTTIPEDVPQVTESLSVEPLNQKPNLENLSVPENVIANLPIGNATKFQGNLSLIPSVTNVSTIYSNVVITINDTSLQNNVTLTFYDNTIGIPFTAEPSLKTNQKDVTSDTFNDLGNQENSTDTIIDITRQVETTTAINDIDPGTLSTTDYTSTTTEQSNVVSQKEIIIEKSTSPSPSDLIKTISLNITTEVTNKLETIATNIDPVTLFTNGYINNATEQPITTNISNQNENISDYSTALFNSTKKSQVTNSVITIDETTTENGVFTYITIPVGSTLPERSNVSIINTKIASQNYNDLENITADIGFILPELAVKDMAYKTPETSTNNKIMITTLPVTTETMQHNNVSANTEAVEISTRNSGLTIHTSKLNGSLETGEVYTIQLNPTSSSEAATDTTEAINFTVIEPAVKQQNINISTTPSFPQEISQIDINTTVASITGNGDVYSTTISYTEVNMEPVGITVPDTPVDAEEITTLSYAETITTAAPDLLLNMEPLNDKSNSINTKNTQNYVQDDTAATKFINTHTTDSIVTDTYVNLPGTKLNSTVIVTKENYAVTNTDLLNSTSNMQIIVTPVNADEITTFSYTNTITTNAPDVLMNMELFKDKNISANAESTKDYEQGATATTPIDNTNSNYTISTTDTHGNFSNTILNSTVLVTKENSEVIKTNTTNTITNVQVIDTSESITTKNPNLTNTIANDSNWEALTTTIPHDIVNVSQPTQDINKNMFFNQPEAINKTDSTFYDQQDIQILTESSPITKSINDYNNNKHKALNINTTEPADKSDLVSTQASVETLTTDALFLTTDKPLLPVESETLSTSHVQIITNTSSTPDLITVIHNTNPTKGASGNENNELNGSNIFGKNNTSPESVTEPTRVYNIEQTSITMFNSTETSTSSPAGLKTIDIVGVTTLDNLEILNNSNLLVINTDRNLTKDPEHDAESIDFVNPFNKLGGNITGKLIQVDPTLSINYKDNNSTIALTSNNKIRITNESTVMNETSDITVEFLFSKENSNKKLPEIKQDRAKDTVMILNNNTEMDSTTVQLNYENITSTMGTLTISTQNITRENFTINEMIAKEENRTLSVMKDNITLIEATKLSVAITDQNTNISTEQIEKKYLTEHSSTSLPLVTAEKTEAAFVSTDYALTGTTQSIMDETTLFNLTDPTTEHIETITAITLDLNNENNKKAITTNNTLKHNQEILIPAIVNQETLNGMPLTVTSEPLKVLVQKSPGIVSRTESSLTTTQSIARSVSENNEANSDKETKYITTNTPIIIYLDTNMPFKHDVPPKANVDSVLNVSTNNAIFDFNYEITTTQKPEKEIILQQNIKPLIDLLSIPEANDQKQTSSLTFKTNSITNKNTLVSDANTVHAVTPSKDLKVELHSTTVNPPLLHDTIVTLSTTITSTGDTILSKQEKQPTTVRTYDLTEFGTTYMTLPMKGSSLSEKEVTEMFSVDIPSSTSSSIMTNTTQDVLHVTKDNNTTLLDNINNANASVAFISQPILVNQSDISILTSNTEATSTIDSIKETVINLQENVTIDGKINQKRTSTETTISQNITPILSSRVSPQETALSSTYLYLDTQSIVTGNTTTAISDNDKVTKELPISVNISNEINAIENNITQTLSDISNYVATNYSVKIDNSSNTESEIKSPSFIHPTDSRLPTSAQVTISAENSTFYTTTIGRDNDNILVNSIPVTIDKPIIISMPKQASVTYSTEINLSFNMFFNAQSYKVQTTAHLVPENYTPSPKPIDKSSKIAVQTTGNLSEQNSILTSTVTDKIAILEKVKPSKPSVIESVGIISNSNLETYPSPILQLSPEVQIILDKNLQIGDTSENYVSLTNSPTAASTDHVALQNIDLPKDTVNLDRTTTVEIPTTSITQLKNSDIIMKNATVNVPEHVIKPKFNDLSEPALSVSPFNYGNMKSIAIPDVLLVKNIENKNTHSGIISSIPMQSKHSETKEKLEILEKDEHIEKNKQLTKGEKLADDEENKGKSIKVPTASPLDKITTATYVTIDITKENMNRVLQDNSTREELLIETDGNTLNSKNTTYVEPVSKKYSTAIKFHNDTYSSASGYEKETPTHDPIENSSSKNASHTSNSKSQYQNNSIPQASNTTVISEDQSNASRNMSQTKLTAAADMQTTGFPTYESTTSKPNISQFSCVNKKGRYSDEKNCRRFYICQGNDKVIEKVCPVNTVFSEINKQCTKNLSHCIRNNQFRCVAEGHFSDFLNDNVYYICVKNNLSHFIRFKLLCQNGYRLNKTSVRCVLNTESTSTGDSSKSVSEQSTSSAKTEKPDEETNGTKKFKCEEEGIFPDPSNCRKYFVCAETDNSGYLQKKKKCDKDEIFHKDKKKCVDADSYEC